ncbi:hypothetical protein LFZ31_01850 [Salmonella enterica subsp. enterica serovar Newport str. S09097]|nr:hypothetical protein LFZ31_01850 [Salmonella enterica subsp. enterica serovar Newport str. S09097]
MLCNMWNGLSMGHKVTEEEYAVISIQEHKSILQALELHDETLARQRMREHIYSLNGEYADPLCW